LIIQCTKKITKKNKNHRRAHRRAPQTPFRHGTRTLNLLEHFAVGMLVPRPPPCTSIVIAVTIRTRSLADAPWTCKLCRCRKNNRRHSRVAADKAKMLEMLATAAPVPAPPLTTAAPVPAPPTPPPRTPGEIPRATADRMQWWMSPEVEKKSVASARPDHKLELAGGTGRVPGGAQPVGMEYGKVTSISFCDHFLAHFAAPSHLTACPRRVTYCDKQECTNNK